MDFVQINGNPDFVCSPPFSLYYNCCFGVILAYRLVFTFICPGQRTFVDKWQLTYLLTYLLTHFYMLDGLSVL